MKFVILASETLKEELIFNGVSGNVDVSWIKELVQFKDHLAADIFCDLLFDGSDERIKLLEEFSQPVIINSPVRIKGRRPFIRINGWPGFLKGNVIEASCADQEKMKAAENFFSVFNKKIEWLPDETGFVSARIVAMIINEAYLALGEGVSTKEEIDIAMKLGTNYPFGPFEWSQRIGLKKIYTVLMELSERNSKYHPAEFLQKELSQ